MYILGIETSCDETAISVLEFSSKTKYKILSNVVSSQVAIHAPFGGVVPSLAAREHEKNLPVCFAQSLKKAKVGIEQIGAIAITTGPGLSPALWRGVRFAQELSRSTKLPLIPVNHVEAHIYSAILNKKTAQVPLPAMALIVSGGHTQLVLIDEKKNMKIIGETRDDAAGEAFDKIAKILGLGYPGGPIVSRLAKKGKKDAIAFPRPMIYLKNFDFSFSGLKTSVLYTLQDLHKDKSELSQKEIADFCASAQEAIVEVLTVKTIKAMKHYGARTLLVGGGVSANAALQSSLKKAVKKELPDVRAFFPKKEFYTDNAAPIAYNAALHLTPTPTETLEANPNMRISGKFYY